MGLQADAPESYDIPSRGRHYTDIWDEEDGLPFGTTPRLSVPSHRQLVSGPMQGGLALPHFVPSIEMRDENLIDEHRGLGSLTERIVAALLGRSDKAIHEKQEHMPMQKFDGSAFEGDRDAVRVDVVELEDRMKKELKGVMLLGEHEEYDATEREDGEVTSALRQCQHLLLKQTSLNEDRKARLAEVSRHRLALTDYQAALEGIEKSIEAGWAKRLKKYGTAPRRSGGQAQERRPPVPEHLRKLVAIRKSWKDAVGKAMRKRPKGEVIRLPMESVFEGIGREIDERDEKIVEEVEVESMDVDEM